MKLNIATIDIRQDAHGRYSLADLHKAAGGEKRHLPSYWLTNKQTKETIAILEAESRAGIPALPVASNSGGKYEERGTFVVWELVYAYAMWISPKFNLHVIRTFHTLQTRPRVQHEKSVKQRYDFYPPMRQLVLDGKKDVEIAPLIGRSPGSVRYHRAKQFTNGYTDPVEYAHKRYPAATAQKMIAKHHWDDWGSDYETPQAGFDFEGAQA